MSFKCKKYLEQHLKCRRHTDQINIQSPVPRYACSVCGKKYSIRQSLHAHTRLKSCVKARIDVLSIKDILHQQQIDEMKQAFEKERQEMKLAFEETMKEQINKILEKHAGTTNNTTNNTSNIETQNINIIIKAFGNENTDYIDDKAILACIGRVYKSIPSLLEKIHFDPNHPENHNIKITNKKLPYASIMGDNQKWKTVDRKNAIEKMVTNSYNMLDEKYTENKEKFSTQKKDNFEGFQSKFESDDKELMKQIKTEVDMMVLNGGG
jgi:hypothetical protein